MDLEDKTSLTITDVIPTGYIQLYNPVKQSQYFVFLLKTSSYSGELKGAVEGNVRWMTLDEMLSGKLAPNMKQYLAVFQNENIPQAYGMSGKKLQMIENNGKII
ncbi:MAG: hypothetical protein J6Q47_00105 [Paludibacteraceae bacterium]|nr:hypothetical protein [Paludibacteraceae bacterium]